MDVEYFLSRYKTITTEIASLTEQYIALQSIVERTTTTIRDMPGGGQQTDLFSSTVSKMLDVQASIDDLTVQASCLAFEIGQAVNQIPNPKYRTVLTMFYLRGASYSFIAETLDCTERWVHSMQTKAKDILQAILDHQYNSCEPTEGGCRQ